MITIGRQSMDASDQVMHEIKAGRKRIGYFWPDLNYAHVVVDRDTLLGEIDAAIRKKFGFTDVNIELEDRDTVLGYAGLD